MGVRIDKKHTAESKAKMSKSRKDWLKNNPDKHPWKRHDKFKSKPCENVKTFLRNNNILFIEEYTPDNIERNYSIDIALPDKRISLEVNGNQHYERDGTLKPYYQERQNILENAGWIVYQIHYSACYNLGKWIDFFDKISNADAKVDFNYFTYVPRPKKMLQDLCKCGRLKSIMSIKCMDCVKSNAINKDTGSICKCGNEKHKYSQKCIKCHNKNKMVDHHNACKCGNEKYISSKLCVICNNSLPKYDRRKAVRPSKEELEILIWQKPFMQIKKDYGVSDVAIKKWCKLYGITNFPGRGYWRKLVCGVPIKN